MRLEILIFVVLLSTVGIVSGEMYTFQYASEFSDHITCEVGPSGDPDCCQWFHNTTGGNNWVDQCHDVYIVSQTPLPMTYAAATLHLGWGGYTVMFYNTSRARMSWVDVSALNEGRRAEVKVIGSTGYVYSDGVLQGNTTPLSQNPSYIGWGFGVDDVIWGSTESKYVFGAPEDGFFVMKDMMNPAASGFYEVNQTDPNGTPVLIYSSTMTTSFAKGTNNSEIVELYSSGGGDAHYYNTTNHYAGTIYWNLTELFESNTQYGLLRTTIHDQIPSTDPFRVSDVIPYIGAGSSIQFDKNSYAIGESALLTVIISDSYYDTSTYDYHVVIQDIYGELVYDEPISFSTSSPYVGTATYTWDEDNEEGVYYGLIYATKKSDDTEILMNYDVADVNSNVVINGFVFDAETESVITGAVVNVTQGTTTDTSITGADGNYSSTSSFSVNHPTTIVASASGYETYQHVFTPLYAGTIQINLTLMPTNPTYSGIALGGIARTPPYNRTINSALVTIKNGTQQYLTTTNSVGYYIQNNMPNGSVWDIWGSKIGFSNSTIYQKLVFGS